MIENIKKLGLNEYEARAYKSLLPRGKDTAVSVSKAANIPRARVYDVLFSLEKKGFVTRSASKPIEFAVVKPLHAFNRVADKKKQELDLHLEEFRTIAATLEDSLGNIDLGEDSAWVVSGRDNIYSKIAEELDNCQEAVVISSSEDGIKRKRAFFCQKLADLSDKGVKIISRNNVNSRFVVFDKNSVLLFMSPEGLEKNSEKALLIRSPFVANFFRSSSKK